MPIDETDPIDAFNTITEELVAYGQGIEDKPRWVVLNKLDTLSEEDKALWVESFKEKSGWNGPLYAISAIGREGTQELCAQIHQALGRLLEDSQAGSDA